jgi:Zn-dependent protease
MQPDRAQVSVRQDGIPLRELDGRRENIIAMHDDPTPSPLEGEYQPPQQPSARRPAGSASRWRSAGGAAVAAGLLAAKFKGVLLLLSGLKVLAIAPGFLLSIGSIVASMWLYGVLFGWKLGIVIVLLVLVHEMGHWVVIRGYGGKVSLPYFIPGLAAFVAQKSPLASADQDAYAALAGPIVGTAASGCCWALGVAAADPFWIAAAYIGFFLNLFNLIPVLPFDGGRVAAAIDPRLWIAGGAVFLGCLVAFHAFGALSILLLVMVAMATVPRVRALARGYVDPRIAALTPAVRGSLALAYFATLLVAGIGALATQHVRG